MKRREFVQKTTIGAVGTLFIPEFLRGMDLVESGDSLIVIVSSSGNNKLTLVNFGNSITNR